MANKTPNQTTYNPSASTVKLTAIPFQRGDIPALPKDLPFDSFFVKTDSVGNAIMQFAKEHRINPKIVDFDLVSVLTIISDNDNEARILGPEEYGMLIDTYKLLNPAFSIRQSYEIRIRPVLPSKQQLILTMTADRSVSRVTATIKKESKLICEKGLEEWLTDELNKRKARNGLLIDLWNFKMHEDIVRLTELLRANNGVLDQDYDIEMCRGLEPILTVNDALIFRYKEKLRPEKERDRTDRSYIISVAEGEVVVEYIKPKAGFPGRNCRGNYVAVANPSVQFKPEFKIGEAIKMVETEESIQYIAKHPGFVTFENELLDINDELALKEISFKQTGSIKTVLDSSIKVEINEGDIMDDSVRDNMRVEVAELRVKGSIGRDASVKAHIVEIGGQTHQTSMIEAEEATISCHRGQAKGGTFTFSRIEGGSVFGNTVTTEQCIGGRVTARTIAITTLNSNNIITASKLIEIKNIAGEHNKLIIKPLQIGHESIDIDALQSENETYGKLIETLNKESRAKLEIIKQNNQKLNDIKRRIIEDKRAGRITPSIIMAEHQHFLQLIQQTQENSKKIEELTTKINANLKELESVQGKVLEAKIICHSVWHGDNNVVFELTWPRQTLLYTPPEGKRVREIGLQLDKDGRYEIKPIF